jgi:hypothetical protein
VRELRVEARFQAFVEHRNTSLRQALRAADRPAHSPNLYPLPDHSFKVAEISFFDTTHVVIRR